ncbi:glycosyltransferase family 4 protein [Methanocella conradii]|uniref:glycosyltransferase family 4 protein n=1 Tax=Methanocella conradii TaxID=1175444 RepID=UPI00157DE8B8|nr:glycosyltransferase family 4 protein [Methanocella conradii]
MRVLIVTGFIPSSGGGGVERHVYDLACGLMRRGVDVTIACEDRQNFSADYSDIKDKLLTVRVSEHHFLGAGLLRKSSKLSLLMDSGKYAWHMLRRSWLLSRSFNPDDFDIIHGNAEHGLFPLLKNRLRHGKRPIMVNTMHGTVLGVFHRMRKYRLTPPIPMPDQAVGIAMDCGSAWMANACIAVSRNVAIEATTLYHLPKERVNTIYNWTDKQKFYPHDKAKARKALGLDPDEKYLFFVGRADAIKGYGLLLKAMEYVDRDAQLIVASSVTGKLGEAKMKNVRVLGRVGEDVLPLYYSACDLFMFPSVYEGLPLTLIEAISCGAVPVCMNLPPMTEIVDDTNGYMCERFDPIAFADTVNRALRDEDRAEKSRLCVETSKKFDMDRSIDATLALYQSLLRR